MSSSDGVRPFGAAPKLTSDTPWLLLGKGPSAAQYRSELAHRYPVFALNHAMRGIAATIGHAADIEVLDDLNESDLSSVEFLCLPWIPHVRLWRPLYAGKTLFGPGSLTLLDYCARKPLLESYRRRGRLLAYNLASAPTERHHPALPTIHGKTFSAALAVRLLAQAGVRQIRTLGVDGGSDYCAAFADIAERSKLQTAQTSFDIQFTEIAETIHREGLDFGPLDQQIPARVFVGCMPEQDLAYQVLEYSIRRHSSVSVVVERLHSAIAARGIRVPIPHDPANRGRTPFSFQRFAIPALCDRKGRAVYLDSDMLVLRDLRPLWAFALGDCQLVSAAPPPGSPRPPQFSVMLLDCERLPWDVETLVAALDAGTVSYAALMYEMATVPSWEAALPWYWNSLEHHEPEHTCLLHFTDMNNQPWLNALHPQAALWCRYLLDAIKAGDIAPDEVAKNVRHGHVRPSLLTQVERGEVDPLRLPFRVLAQDPARFLPVHLREAGRVARARFEWRRGQALLRYAYYTNLQSPLRHYGSKAVALGRKWLGR